MEIPLQYVDTVCDVVKVFNHLEKVISPTLSLWVFLADIRTMRVMTLRMFKFTSCISNKVTYSWYVEGSKDETDSNNLAGFEPFALRSIIDMLGLNCHLRAYYYIYEESSKPTVLDIDSYLRQMIVPAETIDTDVYKRCIDKITTLLNDPIKRECPAIEHFIRTFTNQEPNISSMLDTLYDVGSSNIINLMPESERPTDKSYLRKRKFDTIM